MRFMPIPSVRLVRELLELSKTFRATPTLANANCDLLFPFHEAVPAVDAFAMGTSGVSEISLRRYMPSPAGLSDIDDKSAPSEVKAPPIPITRAVPENVRLRKLRQIGSPQHVVVQHRTAEFETRILRLQRRRSNEGRAQCHYFHAFHNSLRFSCYRLP